MGKIFKCKLALSEVCFKYNKNQLITCDIYCVDQ